MAFRGIVLAGGKGTRMQSDVPKVLHTLCDVPMVCFPVQALLDAGAREVIVVVGHGAEAVTQMLSTRFDARVRTALQSEPRGTGDAARAGFDTVADDDGLMAVLYGDAALMRGEVIHALLGVVDTARPLAMVTTDVTKPTGYGRILRDQAGRIVGVREERDTSDAERAILEINPGVYLAQTGFLREALSALQPSNAQGELYLTDIVAQAAGQGGVVSTPWASEDLEGINDRWELAVREGNLRQRIVQSWARRGVTFRDPSSVSVGADVTLGVDVTIGPGVSLRGRTSVGAGSSIDVGSVLTDTVVGPGVEVRPYVVATESQIGAGAKLGPFTHLRPGSVLGAEVHLGNFVETKATRMGAGSKANHLAYLGDGEVGARVNIGAGTIFCNYDGAAKHQTVIEDDVFVGSDSQLVAPVRIGKGAYVASGTTVTRDVPADSLAISRSRQENKEGYAARLRRRSARPK